MNSKKIIVLGGGTAGWLTALFVKKNFPSYDVKVIQNKSIGIIGVGEATTPQIIDFLLNIDINLSEFIKETGGTIKNGINFENWNGDGKRYFHGFVEKISQFKIDNIFTHDCFEFYLKNLIKQKKDFNEYTYSAKLSYEDKVDIKNISFALHFDTHLVSLYLQKIGKQRNIECVEGKFKNVTTDENGFIRKIILEDSTEHECDFVYDCSGFARLLVGKHFNTKWKSYKENLPMKKGIPFYLDYDGKIPPYTSAIAMKYGWIWKIPLQHRYGSGYIFDSDYIDENQALDEAEKHFNTKIKVNKIIPFEAGRYEQYWVKNCMAVGLSSSFIEPLESTSIFLTIKQLFISTQFFNELERCDEKNIKRFNEICADMMDDALGIVYLHYVTKRSDSDFWKDFKHNYKPPASFEELLDSLKNNTISFYDIKAAEAPFALHSYLQIANGLELFEKEINVSNYEAISPRIEEYKKLIDSTTKQALDHKEFLLSLK